MPTDTPAGSGNVPTNTPEQTTPAQNTNYDHHNFHANVQLNSFSPTGAASASANAPFNSGLFRPASASPPSSTSGWSGATSATPSRGSSGTGSGYSAEGDAPSPAPVYTPLHRYKDADRVRDVVGSGPRVENWCIKYKYLREKEQQQQQQQQQGQQGQQGQHGSTHGTSSSTTPQMPSPAQPPPQPQPKPQPQPYGGSVYSHHSHSLPRRLDVASLQATTVHFDQHSANTKGNFVQTEMSVTAELELRATAARDQMRALVDSWR